MARPTFQKRAPRNMRSSVTSRPFAGVVSGANMSINKDQVEGRAKEAAGKIQEVAGKTVGSTTQRVKGAINKTVGAAQAAYGDAKSRAKDSNKDASR
jgi:uncharacterized protein YjbJ (UPF0337 family)